MFVVTEAEAAAIRAVYEQRGEFSAAVELRRRPAVSWHHRQCAGTGVRPDHRRLEACASGPPGKANVARRHMTKGAIAMVVAKAYPDPGSIIEPARMVHNRSRCGR
jgi:hypothetical protein